jgi:two-component system, cell cycle sensor histidine kinase and response regulator CckA
MNKTEHQHGGSGYDVQSSLRSNHIPITFGRGNALVCFGFALLVTLMAAALFMLFPAIAQPYYFFVAAIALATWYGGWKPGALSLVLSAVLAIFCMILPYRHASASPLNLTAYLAFMATSALVFALSASLQRTVSELNKSHLHFGGVVQMSEDAILTIDERQNITLFNAGAEKIFGYDAADVLGKSVNMLLPEPFRPMHAAHVQAFANSPDALRPMNRRDGVYGLRKDGNQFPAEASISKFEAGGMKIMTVRLRDITERVAAEHTLRQLAAIVESSKDAIIGENLDGIIQSWNPGAEEMYGYAWAEVLAKPATILLPTGAEDEVAANVQRAREGVSTNYDTVRMRKDGKQIKVALTVSPIRDSHGAVVGASTIARDITERHRLEQQLHQSQKMEAVGLLAGGVAHDFNNLLGVIVGYAYLVHTSGSSDEHVRNLGQQIINAAEKGSALTRQLLAFGRKQIMIPKVIDLSETTAGLGEMIPRLLGEDIEVRIVHGERLKHVKADPSQFEQVIMNLAVNARDAMPDGGKLTIETSNVYFDEVDARHNNLPPGDYVLLAVSDTGEGMSDETRAHIFEPFFTTKDAGKGTGLGLATVYGIVSQSQGYIWVYSELGNGTTFKIYLPATAATAATTPLTAHRHQLTVCGTETVLLVEDQAELRELFTQVLRDKGYKVLSANGGRDALQQMAKQNSPVHLLLTDVIMPEMRGNKVAEALADRYPDMKVVYMSGYTDSALIHSGSLPEDMVFLQKPFTPDAMLRLIREVLDDAAISRRSDRRNAV